MTPQRKAKKPARIKGRVMYVSPDGAIDHEGLDHWNKNWMPDGSMRPRLSLPIDNPAALVEQVARAMARSGGFVQPYLAHYCYARAALRSIGVPIKGGRK